jgi:hypothetical protein
LGGYAHGYWWNHPLCRRIAFLLHITAWEFMAFVLNVIIFSLLSLRVTPPFGTQTPFLQFKL